MLVPNEILLYWNSLILSAFLNRDWEPVEGFLVDMHKISVKIMELQKQELKKQAELMRKQRNTSTYQKGKGKYTRVIK